MFSRHNQLQRLGFRSITRVGILAATIVAAAQAAMPDGISLGDRIRQSELVFEGVVVAIDHRNSQVVEAGDVPIPHAFVTFEIAETFKGKAADGNRITLRFIGGPNGAGLTLAVSGVPQFNVGDREILFVRQNGEDECPLVGRDRGRMRVIRGEVYDDQGAEVWLTPEGGQFSAKPAVDVSTMPYLPLPVDPLVDEFSASRLPEGSTRLDAAGMRTVLRRIVLESLAAAKQEVVRSANAGADFVYQLPRPSDSPKKR